VIVQQAVDRRSHSKIACSTHFRLPKLTASPLLSEITDLDTFRQLS